MKIGDLCDKGSQLRPHIVWFGEAVPEMDKAIELTQSANILSVVSSDKKENSANSTQENTTTENVIYETPKQNSFFGQIWNYIVQMFN